ncbi:hypothetical protein EST38_g4024 [Candolleomyces aberdarensis]|uniref:Uncharacterized protein n=1 Tax=Candolleomyces aberdarensis TaxID=2316362 RepID=A0A4Q2DNK6_9AGAR|nr:hypothetical protein EST38_g4024 [Candolleomyces aberdarensis]
MTLDDQSMLAGLAAVAAGGAAQQKADGSPFFAHVNLEHGGAVPFPASSSSLAAAGKRAASQGGDNAADPDATPMPIKEEEGGGDGERALRMVEGPRIHRPLSSLAVLPPSSVQDLNWSSYLGLGTPGGAYGGMSGGMGGISGWTPGGNVAAYAASLAGLGEHNNSQFGAMPTGMTPGKEMDPKELREFWKQYLRTPLTGPETVTAEDSEKMLGADNSTAGTNNAGVSTPYRRPRVTSMPSSNKTPVAGDRDRLFAAGLAPGDSNYHHRYQQQPSLGPTSSMRTTLHPREEASRREDLASYEAAVLARKAPMNLSMNRLSTRRKGASVNPTGASQLFQASSAGQNMTTAIGRDRSMSEVSNASSTAGNHYGGPEQRPSSNAARELMILHHQSPYHRSAAGAGSDESTSGSGGASPASRASSLGVDATMESLSRPSSSAGLDAAFGQGVGMQHPQRPVAKRLASSVLESDNPKAMKFDSAMSPEGSGTGDVSMVSPPIALQPPPLGTLATLPPLSTQGLDGVGKSTKAMMAPPPPNSAPPQGNQNSLLGLNLPRTGSGVTLAERRRMATANIVGRSDFDSKSRRMSDAL